jgi:hypothetical protein
MQLLLHVEVVGGVVVGCGLLDRIRHGTTKHLRAILEYPGGGVVDGERGWNGARWKRAAWNGMGANKCWGFCTAVQNPGHKDTKPAAEPGTNQPDINPVPLNQAPLAQAILRQANNLCVYVFKRINA